MKKRIFAIAVIMICLAVVGYGTLAFFTDEAVAHNVITTGSVDVEIHETTEQGLPFRDVSGVMPGKSVSKIVQVKNTGDADAWVRVKVEVKTDPDGLPLTIQDKQGKTVNAFQMDFDLGSGEQQWVDGGDGYYYYNSPVDIDGITAALFENVKFDPQMGNEYQNCKVMINIFAEAVQVANNPAPDGDVTAIKGWPTLEKGGTAK